MSERAAQKCKGKKRHGSERKANFWAERTQRSTGVAMRGYPCEYCKGWHVGSSKVQLRPDRELPRSTRHML